MKDCPNKAEYIVPWTGKLLKACAQHANAIAKIGEVIGSPVQIEKIITDENCFGKDEFNK